MICVNNDAVGKTDLHVGSNRIERSGRIAGSNQVHSGFSNRVVPAETESCIPDRIVTTSPVNLTFSYVNMAETVNDSASLINGLQEGDRGARDARSRSPVQVNSRSNDPTDPVDSFTRENCKYGEQCYRKNVEHRREFSHPGDPDYDVNTDKPECPYGSRCYRKNRLHKMQYTHKATHCNYGYTRRRNAVAGSSRQRFSEESSDAEESVDESEYEPDTDDQDETTGDEKFDSDDSYADDHS